MSTLHLSASLDLCTQCLCSNCNCWTYSSHWQQEQKLHWTWVLHYCMWWLPRTAESKAWAAAVLLSSLCCSVQQLFHMKAKHLSFSSIKTNILFSSLTAHVRYSLTHPPSQKRLYWNQGLCDSTTISPNPRFCQLLVVLWSKWIHFSHTASIILWIPSLWTKIRRGWTTNSQNLFADQKIKITQILKRLKAVQKLCHVLTCRSQNKYQCTLWPAKSDSPPQHHPPPKNTHQDRVQQEGID